MIRLLILILLATFVAFMGTWLISMTGEVAIDGFGTKTSIPAGVAIGILVIGAVLVAFLTACIYYFTFLPKRLRQRAQTRRTDRGVTALARGLEAVAVGEAGDAMHHAKVAERNLPDASLTRLLVAQSAQLSGDETAVQTAYTAMLDAPETTFLGLRGLYASAMRRGDKDAARAHAEKAFALRPHAQWAFESVLDLALDRGAWGDGLAAIESARKSKAIDADRANRGEAALLTAAGAASALSGDETTAQSEVEQAVRRQPGFAPAAALAAKIYAARGKADRARKTLEAAYAAEPHYALAVLYAGLDPQATDEARAAAFEKIAGRNHGARLSTVLRAEAEILRGRFDAAISQLEGAIVKQADQRALILMGNAVRNAHGEGAARHWFDRAAARPSDGSAGLDGTFTYSREGWASLIREYMNHGRLAPLPLEDVMPGLSPSELAALLPAPDEGRSDEGSIGGSNDTAAIAEIEDMRDRTDHDEKSGDRSAPDTAGEATTDAKPKADAAQTDASKTDASKTDAAKTDAGKTGAGNVADAGDGKVPAPSQDKASAAGSGADDPVGGKASKDGVSTEEAPEKVSEKASEKASGDGAPTPQSKSASSP